MFGSAFHRPSKTSERHPMLDRTEAIQGSRAKRIPATSSPVNPSEREAPHIVVVGGGVAGLILATRLGHSRWAVATWPGSA